MNHVAAVIEDEPVYTLLDEQFVAFQSILSRVRQSFHTREKSVFIIHGGPGTGKSVLATNLVARLSKQHYTVNHATGSKAFTENLSKRVGSRASVVFNYFNNYTQATRRSARCPRLRRGPPHPEQQQPPIHPCGAALRQGPGHRADPGPPASRSSSSTTRRQVRPGEVGSSQLIREEADRQDAVVVEHELEAQFRCAGSDGFVNWIDNTLGLRKTANILWNQGGESFDFRIVGSVEELDREIRTRTAVRLAHGWSPDIAGPGRRRRPREVDSRRTW